MPVAVAFLIALPLVAALAIFLIRRSGSFSGLVPAIVLSGCTGAILTACFAFSIATVPIAPYETSAGFPWTALGELLLAVYVGFGIGALLSSVLGVPYWVLSGRTRAGPAPPGPAA